jgi:Cu/Ag efflux protein CusF
MKKFLLVLFSLYLAIVFLMPKVELYYTLKSFFQPQHIVLAQDSVKDRWFDLKIENLKLLYDGIESAEAETVTVMPWLFYNRLSAANVRAGKDVRKMFDFNAEEVLVTHSVISPFIAKVSAFGNFGKVEGKVDLQAGKVKLICEPSKSFKSSSMFRELFRKRDEGYVHESNIR